MKKILGYSDQLTVRPGQTLVCRVSSLENEPYDAQLVRLENADSHSEQARFREVAIDCDCNGTHRGLEQAFPSGSCVSIPSGALTSNWDEFSLIMNIMPTAPTIAGQHIVTQWDPAVGAGWRLTLTDNGALSFQISDGNRDITVTLPEGTQAKCWYQVTVRASHAQRLLRLTAKRIAQSPLSISAEDELSASVELDVKVPVSAEPLLIGSASSGTNIHGQPIPKNGFYGRIENPVVYRTALTDEQLARVCEGARPQHVAAYMLADWDFSQAIGTTSIRDRSPNRLHGTTINLPQRAVRGTAWAGETNWRNDPKQYTAIHFHGDDLYDCGWNESFKLRVPDDLKSGVYAVRLRRGGSCDQQDENEDYLTFFVAPPKHKPQARLALILPTFTYLAYGNMRFIEAGRKMMGMSPEAFYGDGNSLGPGSGYYGGLINAHPEVGSSVYDFHADGTPLVFSSWLRPLLSMRPKSQLLSFGADMLFVDWLEEKDIAYDVITDDLLQKEGVELLRDYSVVMSGNHPEYPTTEQLDAIEAYLAGGGRWMYMGGNGYYWRAAVSEELPGVIEMRRGRTGSGTSKSDIGESYLEFTGEKGGIWLDIGRPPQQLFGVGFIAAASGMGESASHFRVQADARTSRASFVLEGVGDDVFGNYGILEGAAAGQEIDQVNYSLGSPENVVVIARSEDHGPGMVYVIEEMASLQPLWEVYRDRVYADVVFFETPHGGAVFSVGTMTWCGCLSHNEYQNSVSTITENVIRRFTDEAPFETA
ncbi:MAG: N,N-dimethylformamidase beta subunit family domain-containing protein [Pseudomonadota bacterium]